MNQTSHFQIIDQQDDFIVINKAANVNFHDEGDIGHGLFNEVKTALNLNELYPVHRLDKMTSGLLIFAKNKAAAQTFQQLFERHQIIKYYLAVSDKKPKKKQGLIKGDMVKSRRSAWKLLRTLTKPAITQFFSYGLESGKRTYLVKPHSGKTHQIRVALSSIGAPILGDPIYSNSKADRGYLHALALTFNFNGVEFEYVEQPQSGDHFSDLSHINDIEKPWLLPWPSL